MNINIIKHTVPSIASIVSGLLRNKLLAVWGGAGGVGLYGIMQVVVALIVCICTMGVDVIISNKISKSNNKNKIIANAIGLGGIFIIFGTFSAILCVKIILPIYDYNLIESSDAVTVALAVIFSIISLVGFSLMKGLQLFREIIEYQILMALFSMVGVVFFQIIYGEFIGAIYILAIPISGTIALFLKLKINWPDIFKNIKLSRMIQLVKNGVPLMSANVILMLGGLVTRLVLLKTTGEKGLGFYQAVIMITGVYSSFIFNAITIELMPKLASLKNMEEFRKIVNEHIKESLKIACPLIFLCILFSKQILQIIFVDEFSFASRLFQLYLMTDMVRIFTVSYETALLALGKNYLYLLIKSFQIIIFNLFLYLFSISYGIDVSGIIFLSIQILTMVVLFFIFYKNINLPLVLKIF